MPVRFACQHCRKTLSISRRKVGADVSCPRCGGQIVVPDEQTAAASLAMAGLARAEAAFDAIPEVIVYDDVPELIADWPPASGGPAPGPGAAPASLPGPQRFAAYQPPAAFPPSAAPPPVTVRPASPSGEAMLLVSRRAVYAQGVLLLAVAVGAFAAGYLIGRARGPLPVADAAAEPVVLEGNVVYAAAPGRFEPDADAVVLALPTAAPPRSKLPAAGFRPGDEAAAAALAALDELGGAYARADPDGEFHLVLPGPGEYLLVWISRHADRDGRQPIRDGDAGRLSVYFEQPGELIGRQQYELLVRGLEGLPERFTQRFGANRTDEG